MPIQGDVPLLALMKDSKRPDRQVSELIFLAGQPNYFSDKAELLYSIKRAIASRYGVPLHQILICGSAHVGCSVHKDQNFIAGSSDLDLAIIPNYTLAAREAVNNRAQRQERHNLLRAAVTEELGF